MDDELLNLIKVWTIATQSFCYCFYISARLPKGFLRLISLLPIFYFFFTLPLNLYSFHLCATTAFFLAWLANFKLLLFSFGQGPLSSPPPPNVIHFISIASLPIRTKPIPKPKPKPKVQNGETNQIQYKPNEIIISPKLKSILFVVKVSLLAILFHSYNNYTQYLHKNVVSAMYCVHTYLEVEIVLALSAIPAEAMFGSKLEPVFNEPYLATSLQDFWGNRWNLTVTSVLRPTVYNPIRSISTRILGPRWGRLPGVIGVFVISGLMHELIYYYVTRAYPTWEVTWFFILQGAAVVIEVVVKEVMAVKWRLHQLVSGPLVVGFVMVNAVWLFLPQLIRNKVDEKIIREYSMLMDLIKVYVFPFQSK